MFHPLIYTYMICVYMCISCTCRRQGYAYVVSRLGVLLSASFVGMRKSGSSSRA